MKTDHHASKTVITFGTFDVFHIGHLNILQRASALGDRLVVGISSDALNIEKKQRAPVYSQQERMAIVSQIKGVSEVFLEESLEAKAGYLRQYQAQILVMGDDWKGRFDHFSDLCEVVYFARTPSVSTTSIIEVVKAIT
ncbi:adenylyltransferase/cytidyltransferase family protein [Rahnella sp. PD12R]|uniref:adenylyltransferase/cytidyltransferase family protein n=1 Tax=Rahnella sp. PD12R TaxID=2855688 RepID=UPI001C45B1FD|nr:adenylyltransferase/cytidyltransferase family protein [Rahnella sp. PD12R]MBV6820068.1 adenylyltransferase/cytidyltransferase family protein [Rahnella sp. PD12R]